MCLNDIFVHVNVCSLLVHRRTTAAWKGRHHWRVPSVTLPDTWNLIGVVVGTGIARLIQMASPVLAPGTMCILSNLKSDVYKNRTCTIRGWNSQTGRYQVAVNMGGATAQKDILVRPDVLVAFTDLVNDATLHKPVACFKLEGGPFRNQSS